MYKMYFFFKINFHKNKKKKLYTNLGSLFLITYLFESSNFELKKIFTNKYVMLKSPFHYKVSKKLLYNKQCVAVLKIKLNSKINILFFDKFNLINYNHNSNIYKITCSNKFFNVF